VMDAWYYDTPTDNYTLSAKIDAGATKIRMWRTDGATSVEWLNNSPVGTPATGDYLAISGMVEIT